MEGFYSDVWKILEQRLNFTTNVTKSTVKSGIWSSMMKSVKNREYDLVLSGNSQTASRAKFLDFSFAITPSSLRMFHLRDSESMNYRLYINSFKAISWAGIGTSVISIFVLVGSVIFLANAVSISCELTLFEPIQ